MLDHGEVFFREWENRVTEIIVMESKSVLPVEYRKSFFVKGSACSEDTGEDIIFLEIGSPTCITEESIGFDRAVWVNEELLVDFHTQFW